VVDLATGSSPLTRARTRVREVDAFWAGTTAVAAALAGVLGWFLRTWPPHEDEALALFVGRDRAPAIATMPLGANAPIGAITMGPSTEKL